MATSRFGTTSVTDRTETTLANADADLALSHVRLYSPLPEDFPEHPTGIDHLHYIRYRLASGPAASADADAILIMQPGNWAGPYSLDGIARNTLRQAARKGRAVEFWALARRGKGATDNTGIETACAEGDPDLAFGYYYRGEPIDGKSFAGFTSSREMPYLAHLGFVTAVEDTHEVLTRELPDPAVSREKVFVGGHSAGGPVAGAFGAWDFDGVPGHDLVKGFIALDSGIIADGGALTRPFRRPITALGAPFYRLALALLRSGRLPRAFDSIPMMSPEFLYVLRLMGLYATFEPDADVSVMREARPLVDTGRARKLLWELSIRATFAETWRQALTGRPDPLARKLTGTAALGSALGSGFGVHPLRVSMGRLTGGPLRERSFPIPPAAWRIPGAGYALRLLWGRPLRIGADPDILYGWDDSSVDDENVSSLQAFARACTGGPVGIMEPYHPVRFVLELVLATLGVRSDELAHIKHERTLETKPLITILEGGFLPGAQRPRTLRPRRIPLNLGTVHFVPGYSHSDIVCCSARTDGTPEPVADHLTDFLVAHTSGEQGPVIR
ncbi:hypothetical protein [Nocardia huaxiensis]|uniref:hypothetical protein n=1 Tax=Nocardia huaxiensis TaxID=2755382 RepID=UPI001E2C58AD|nr:hypothetical protein [Nocardia huaxiensis]UFS98217.1 hypothetical protein LPY97_10135 [Nocardia huaxiensis]